MTLSCAISKCCASMLLYKKDFSSAHSLIYSYRFLRFASVVLHAGVRRRGELGGV